MLTSGTVVSLHDHALIGLYACCSIVRTKKLVFCQFCVPCTNSTAINRQRLAHYPSMLAGAGYQFVEELSHLEEVQAS